MRASSSFVTLVVASMLGAVWAFAHSDLEFRPESSDASYQGIVARS